MRLAGIAGRDARIRELQSTLHSSTQTHHSSRYPGPAHQLSHTGHGPRATTRSPTRHQASSDGSPRAAPRLISAPLPLSFVLIPIHFGMNMARWIDRGGGGECRDSTRRICSYDAGKGGVVANQCNADVAEQATKAPLCDVVPFFPGPVLEVDLAYFASGNICSMQRPRACQDRMEQGS